VKLVMLRCVIYLAIVVGAFYFSGCKACHYEAVSVSPRVGEAIVFDDCTGNFETRQVP